MRRLLLVRHGLSTWNVERRVQGQGGDGLAPEGHEQAALTARWLAEAEPDAVLVSSDLTRCVETVTPLEEALGRPAQRDPGVRERDFGAWTGHRLAEIERRWPELWARWRGGEDVVRHVGGESDDDLRGRVTAALRRIVDGLADGGAAIVVTHGGPVWHGTHALAGLAAGSLGGVANTSITELGVAGDRAHLIGWNQVTHLPARLHTVLRPSRRAQQAPAVGR